METKTISSPPKSPVAQNSFNFLKIYFDFAFTLGISPFRFKFTNGVLTQQKLWFQRVISFAFSICALIWLARDVQLYIPNEKERGPNIFLKLMFAVNSFCHKTVTLKKFWFNRSLFLSILQFLLAHDYNLYTVVSCRNNLKERIVSFGTFKGKAIFIATLYTTVVLLQVFVGNGLRIDRDNKGHIQRLTLNVWWTGIVRAGRFNYLWEGNSNSTRASSKNSFDTLDNLIGILAVFGYFPRRCLTLYCDLLVLMHVLTLWTATTYFVKLIKLSDTVQDSNCIDNLNTDCLLPIPWTVLRKEYAALKKLTQLVNDSVGTNVTLFLVDALLYYATTFDAIFVEEGTDINWTNVTTFLYYLTSTCFILLLSADIPLKMLAFKDWLSIDENRKSVPADLLYILLNDINTNVVSIKGSGNFSVSFSTLANMLGITVTYFIICLED